ncbi:hypothetical protein CDL60_04755 [Roseateles noduli]|nr:hypothetical protein CDL60_04755 [Roseateles noduli]
MLTVIRRALQAFSVILLVVAVVLAGQSGFSADSATGPIVMILAAGATLLASRFAQPGKLLSPGRPDEATTAADSDLHRASFLVDGGHAATDGE